MKTGREAGFTLLELLIIVVVMALVLAVTYPSLSRGSTALHLRSSGRDILNIFRYAREKAVTEQTGMKVRVEMLEVTSLVIPEGRLDFAAATHFEQRLAEALEVAGASGAALIVDCAWLEYVSSAGLRTFLVTARAAERAGVLFALAALTPAVREVFELSGFNRMIPLHEDRRAALDHVGTRAGRRARLVVLNEAARLPALTRFLQEFWVAAGLPAEPAQAFELALEETFVNIALHGAPVGSARVEVSLHLAGGQLTLAVEDDGPAFDPLSMPPPDVTARLEDRPVGGQGIHLVRQVMDEVSYRRVGKRNQLRMSKRIGS